MVKNVIRALRLPFLFASVLPFVFGSFISGGKFNMRGFILGLFAASFTHLSANLINDYCDSKSGADWQDKRFYGFFGGSKLIQEKVFSEKLYLGAALLCAFIAIFSVALLALHLRSSFVVFIYFLIIILSWQYSAKPLRFSYRMCGELFIFLLFGPALVMGGYFIQTGIFPGMQSFILSLPFGFFTTGILFANEIPDFTDDQKADKRTWVCILGAKNSFILYFLIMFSGFFAVSLGIYLKYISPLAALSFIFLIPAIKAMNILKRDYNNKNKLVRSSQLTIMVQSLVSIALILGVIR